MKFYRKALALLLAVAMMVTGNSISILGSPGGGITVSASETITELNNSDIASLYSGVSYTRQSVHDPSIVPDGNGSYYVFGSHMGTAKTDDLMNWKAVTSENTDSPLYGVIKDGKVVQASYEEAFKENALKGETTYYDSEGKAHTVNFGTYNINDWISPNVIYGNQWAPDVIYNEAMGKWCMYLSLNGSNWNTAVILLTSDNIEGPYVYQAPIVFTGFQSANDTTDGRSFHNTDLELVIGSQNTLPDKYNKEKWGDIWPHCIDPAVFYDNDGKLWMTYGSWSGGIYVLELDEKTGLRDYSVKYENDYNETGSVTTDEYFGKKIAGGYYVSGEGPYIERIGSKYVLFMSYGFYSPEGGYEMRIFYSDNPDGPYTDTAGNSAIYDKYMMNYSAASETDRGQKIIGNYQWDTMDVAEIAQGHNSAYYDEKTGRAYLIYHTKFDDGTAEHQLRVHELFINEDGYIVASPYEYSDSNKAVTSQSSYTASELAGSYDIIIHKYRTKCKDKDGETEVVKPVNAILNEDGTVTGDVTGSWKNTSGAYATLTLDGKEYKGVFAEQNITGTNANAMCFTVLDKTTGLCIWGSRCKDDFAVAYNANNPSVNVPQNLFAGNSIDFTEKGKSGASYKWTSSDISLISEDGTAQAVDTDTAATVKLEISKGKYKYIKDYIVNVISGSSKETLVPIEGTSVMAEYNNQKEAGLIKPEKSISTKTGLSFSMYAEKMKDDWVTVLHSLDNKIQFQFATISYCKDNKWSWYYENNATLSDYAIEQGYDAGSIWSCFKDNDAGKPYYLTISFNTDGSISYYRDGHLMMTYGAGLKQSNGEADITISEVSRSVISAYLAGNLEFAYDINNIIIGYGADYSQKFDIIEKAEEYKYGDTVTVDVEDTIGTPGTSEVYNQVIGQTDKSSAFLAEFSDSYRLTGDFDTTFTFNNYGGDKVYNNYNMIFSNVPRGGEGYTEYAVVRADDWGWGGGDNHTKSGNEIKYTHTWENADAFIDIMQSAKVTLNVKRSGTDVTINAEAVSLDDSSKSYTRTVTFTETTDDMYISFTVDNSYMEMVSIEGLAQVGLSNKTSEFCTAWSDYTTLKDDFDISFDFNNHGSSEANWLNYAFEFRDNNGNYITMRSDNYGWSNKGNNIAPDGTAINYDGTTINWDTFQSIMEDARVDMRIKRTGGIIETVANVVSNTDASLSYVYKTSFSMPASVINLRFTVDHSYLEMNKITYNPGIVNNDTQIQWYRTSSLDSSGFKIQDAAETVYNVQKEDAGNYIYAASNNKKIVFTSQIKGLPVSISEITVKDKEYDGSTEAVISSIKFDGVLDGDTPVYTPDLQFDTALPGTGKTVTGTVVLSGVWAKCYILASGQVNTTGNITGTVPTEAPSTSPDAEVPSASPSTSPDVTPPSASPSTSPDAETPSASPSTSPDVTPPSASPSTSPDVTLPPGTKYTLSYTVNQSAFKNVLISLSQNELGSGETAVLTLKPKTGYGFKDGSAAEIVKTTDNCTVGNQIPDGNGGYIYQISNLSGDCELYISAVATAIPYIVTYNSGTINNTDTSVTNGDAGFTSGSTAVITDKLQFEIKPDKGYTFADVPVITADNASVGEAVMEDGRYIFTVHTFKGDTAIVINGETVKAEYSASIAAGAEKALEDNHAKALLSGRDVAADSVLQLTVTPDEGYQIKSVQVTTEKATCQIQEPGRGANGIWVVNLSGFSGDTVVNNITAEAVKAQVAELGTDIHTNIGAANLSGTDFTDQGIAGAITSVITSNIDIASNINAIIDKETGRELDSSEWESVISALDNAIKKNNNVRVSIEVKEELDLDSAMKSTAGKLLLTDIKEMAAGSNNVKKTELAMPLDISLYASVSGTPNKVSIKDTGDKNNMVIKMTVPSTIQKEEEGVTRSYYMIRFHGGKEAVIPCKYNKGLNTITFESSKFSTYVLCYADTEDRKSPAIVLGDYKGTNTPAPEAATTPGTIPVPEATGTAAPLATSSPVPGGDPGLPVPETSTVPGIVPDSTQTPLPSASPQGNPDSNVHDEPDSTHNPDGSNDGDKAPVVKNGIKVTIKNIKYMVTSDDDTKAARFMGVKKKNKSVTIPSAIKIQGDYYKVKSIANGACKGNKKLQKLVIGNNVRKIGKNAFKNCRNLKNIKIKTKYLNQGKVKKDAFKGINKNAAVQVPEGKVKSYKKLIKAKGAGKKVQVKKAK